MLFYPANQCLSHSSLDSRAPHDARQQRHQQCVYFSWASNTRPLEDSHLSPRSRLEQPQCSVTLHSPWTGESPLIPGPWLATIAERARVNSLDGGDCWDTHRYRDQPHRVHGAGFDGAVGQKSSFDDGQCRADSSGHSHQHTPFWLDQPTLCVCLKPNGWHVTLHVGPQGRLAPAKWSHAQ